jgi:hypothetical protein
MKVVILALVLLFAALVLTRTVEGFGSTSPGTMVQLRTSHVPTEEDDYFYRYIYPQMVNRDLINMTGSGLF